MRLSMQPTKYADFNSLYEAINRKFKKDSHLIHTKRWQGIDITKHPEMASHEILNACFQVILPTDSVEYYQKHVGANLPWAEDHFLERVCGEPLNPGEQWKNWPWAKTAEKSLKNKRFNHNYMERYWPRFARMTEDGKLPTDIRSPHKGIANEYGDLDSIVGLLANEQDTRQAWLPIFFPEDTGIGDGGRKPCTLGYQFIVREGCLHVYYPLRSCDYYRHFKDDIYLTIRLAIWVLEQCKNRRPDIWEDIYLGTLTMHCTSLHVFANDYRVLFGDK